MPAQSSSTEDVVDAMSPQAASAEESTGTAVGSTGTTTRVTTKKGNAPALRTDLNGLRGVAIAMVVVFHIWLGRVSGGVDVFLTLSGFFFTASLIRSARSGGSIDPFTRVIRVLRRLGPPLILVLAVTAAATVLVLPRTRWADIGDQLIAGVFYYVNWQLAVTANDYLAADPSVSPVQHLWSVAVQFQFYLLAIVLVFGLAAVHRFVRREGSSPSPRIYTGLFALLAVASFVYAVDGSLRNQAWNYYDTGARLWEILLGAVLAGLLMGRSSAAGEETSAPRRAPRLRSFLRGGVAFVALATIVGCGFFVDGVTSFPGPLALIPVGATLAMILVGAGTPIGSMLSNRFFSWLGSIAFPLYLWHWPLLIFYLAVSDESRASIPAGLSIIAASVLLSWLTVRLVERPTQAPTFTRGRIAVTGLSALLAVLLVTVPVAWKIQLERTISAVQTDSGIDEIGHPGALELTDGRLAEPADIYPPLLSAADDLPDSTLQGCISDFETVDPISCEYGDVDAARTIVLAGGSHAEHWLTALDALGTEHGFRIVTYLKMGCPLSVDTMPMLGFDEYPDCLDWTQTVLTNISALQPDYVFTTSTRPREAAPGDYTPDFYRSVWAQLIADGVSVLGVRDTPWLSRDGIQFRASDCLSDGGSPTDCGVPRSQALDSVDPALAASFGMPEVSTLDLSDAVCDEWNCRAVQGNVLIYRDEHHLTATYVRTMTTELGRQLGSTTGWWAGP